MNELAQQPQSTAATVAYIVIGVGYVVVLPLLWRAAWREEDRESSRSLTEQEVRWPRR